MQVMSESIIYIGNKRVMSYVLMAVMYFQRGDQRVVFKARGRAISKAVDAATILTSRFLPDADVTEVKIGSEKMGEEGNERFVSTIEITVEKHQTV